MFKYFCSVRMVSKRSTTSKRWFDFDQIICLFCKPSNNYATFFIPNCQLKTTHFTTKRFFHNKSFLMQTSNYKIIKLPSTSAVRIFFIFNLYELQTKPYTIKLCPTGYKVSDTNLFLHLNQLMTQIQKCLQRAIYRVTFPWSNHSPSEKSTHSVHTQAILTEILGVVVVSDLNNQQHKHISNPWTSLDIQH